MVFVQGASAIRGWGIGNSLDKSGPFAAVEGISESKSRLRSVQRGMLCDGQKTMPLAWAQRWRFTPSFRSLRS